MIRTATQRRGDGKSSGFTLLEVLVAVAILAVSLTSLLGSQLNSMLATRYARSLSRAVFLAEAAMIDTELAYYNDGWSNDDTEYSGTFEYLDQDDVRYECVIDFIELPEYSEMVNAKQDADADTDGDDAMYQDAGDQAFGALGPVWPIVKNAIENSIRKSTCTVFWKDGNVKESFSVSTFLVDASRLMMIPDAGGEFTEDDDSSSDSPDAGPGGRPGARPGRPGRPASPSLEPMVGGRG